MNPKSTSTKTQSIAGTTLLVVPFMLVGFTAAMIHIPGDPRPPRAPQILSERGIERAPSATVEAASNNDLLVLRLLRDSGVSLEAANADGITPLMAAARADAHEAMRWLTQRGRVALETPDAAGMTAIAHSIEAGHLDSVEWLAARGAYPGAPGRDGRTPLVVAASQNNIPMVHLLLELGERAGLAAAVNSAVTRDEMELADFLLTQHETELPGSSAALKSDLLHAAVKEGHADRVALLLGHEAPADVPNARGATPLGVALENERRGIAQQLLAVGVSPDAPCLGDASPLSLAWSKRDRETAALLLDHGAAPHPNVLIDAAFEKKFEFVSLLAEHGAPLGSPLDEEGGTLLSRALAEGDHPLAERLLQLGASPSVIGKEGQPVLAIATARGDAEGVRLLLEAGANPNVVLNSPPTDDFLEIADSKMLSYYMKRDSRFTPLMVAAATGDGDTIRALLAGGASRSKYTRSWKRYPISFASTAGHILAQQLITGYDPEKREDQFKMVIDLSSQRATLYKNGQAVNSSAVSTGKSGYRTPTGEYVITHKHRDHKSTIYDAAPMPYFMRFSCGAFGTHTGNCPGYPASHGCIRMPNHKAKQFFYAAPSGTHVSIVE